MADETLLPKASSFDVVDASKDKQFYLNYLDAVRSLDFAKAYKQQTFIAMNAKAGDTVLDIGCGTGEDVLSLAKIVGEKGRAIGIDVSEAVISEAKRRAADAGVVNASFFQREIENLDLTDNSVDSCRADRLFQHITNPDLALNEMIRVTKNRTGRVVVTDPDWDTLVVDSEYKDITRVVSGVRSDGMKNPWSGRKLYRMFKRAGLQDIVWIPIVPCVTDYSIANVLFELESWAKMASDKN